MAKKRKALVNIWYRSVELDGTVWVETRNFAEFEEQNAKHKSPETLTLTFSKEWKVYDQFVVFKMPKRTN